MNGGESRREQPAYGHERILLVPTPRSKKSRYQIKRQVFTERGSTQFYDEATKDWVSWRGKYATIETLGYFESQDAARQFMLARVDAARGRP